MHSSLFKNLFSNNLKNRNISVRLSSERKTEKPSSNIQMALVMKVILARTIATEWEDYITKISWFTLGNGKKENLMERVYFYISLIFR